MANLLFAWELGGGLGHAGALKPLAAELQRRGHAATFVLRDLVQTEPLLRELPGERLQAPLWTFRTVGVPEPPASLAEILLGHGYLRPQHLRAQLQGWLSALRLCAAQALVADYAPTAVLAARVLGLPCATVGTGFFIPPDVQPMPAFRALDDGAGRSAASETQVLQTVNSVLASFAAAPLARLAQLFRGDLALLATWPELDHCRRGALPAGERWFGPSFVADAAPAAGPPAAWPAGSGPKVFAYLKTAHPDHAAVLRALDATGCRTLCYLPEVAAGKPAPVEAASIAYAPHALSLRDVLPGCALLVCHAGTATLAQGLLLGVPLLLLPTHAEQYLVAERAAATGAAINAAAVAQPVDYAVLLRELLDRPAFGAAARAFGARHAGFTPESQTRALCDQVEALLTTRSRVQPQ